MTLAPLLAASATIQLHAAFATAALLASAAVLVARKGTRLHRHAGRSAALALLATSVSSFWIVTGAGYSWIHALAAVSIASVLAGVAMIRTGRRRAHARLMVGAAAGLAVAAMFTLAPGRIIGRIAFGG